ncbi:MAG: exo-alpha-sialidase [Phycisphaerales bacterium]|nr:exo-alpha-sialidase [Phycisphaerales bacterium]
MSVTSGNVAARRRRVLRDALGISRPPAAGFGRRRPALIEQLEGRTLLSVSLTGIPGWVPDGPNPIVAGTGDNVIGPSAATALEVGAVNAIAVDPNNAKHLFIGTVNGGIWQTTDSTVANPNWTTTTDLMPSLAISAIAFSPSSSSVVYAGTGGYSSTFGGVGGAGLGGGAAGVYKSSDGGATWQVLNPGGIFTGLRIRRVVPTTLNGGQTVFVATTDTGINSGGVYRSDDGGATWTRLSGANGLPNAGVTDLVANPANANQYFAALAGGSGSAGTGGIFRVDLSVNTTWSNITGNINTLNAGVLNSAARVELSVSGAGTNPIWASVINSSGFYSDVFRAPDAATVTWAAVGPGGLPPDVLEGAQGSVHGAILADPNSDTTVYLGGDARQNVSPFSAYLARGDSSANTWTALTPVDSMNSKPGLTVIPTSNGVTTAPHPDTRNLVFGAGGNLLLACDGGVYQATSPTGAGPALAWTSIDGNLENTEFYQATLDDRNTATTADDLIQGAAQDNSASERDASGNWNTQVGGDGTVVLADPISDTRYFSVQNFFMGVAVGGGGVSRPAGTVANTGGKVLNNANAGTKAEGFPFSPAFQINEGDIATGAATARVILGGNRTLYVSSDQGSTYTSIGGTTSNNPNPVANLTASVISIAFGDAANTNVCYVAMSDGNIAVTNNITASGGGFSLTTFNTAAGGTLPQSMVIDPNDASTVYVTTQSAVFVTNDGGATWKNITDNLASVFSPGFTQFSNQSGEVSVALFNNGTANKADDVLMVGGPGGIFRRGAALPPGATWTQYGVGLPNVLVDSLQYDAPSDTLLAGTFGRGAWTISSVSTSINTVGVLSINGDTDFPGEDDTIRLIRDANNPATLDVYLNGALTQVPFAAVQQINVNGLGGNDTLVMDSSNGLISVANGIRYDGGGGSDALQLVQTGGASHASDVYSVGPDTGEGTSVISDAGAVQSVSFQNLEPVLDLVPSATLLVSATNSSNAVTFAGGSVASDGKISIDNFESIEFANKAALTLNTLGGSDAVSLNDPVTPTGLTSVSVIGGDPTAGDTLLFNGLATTLSVNTATGVIAGALGTGGAVTVSYAGIEGLTAVAGSSTTLAVTGSLTYAYTAGAALDGGSVQTDSIPITFSGYGSGKALSFTGANASAALTVNGTPGQDAFNLAAGGNVTLTGRAVIQASSFKFLTLKGSGGNDTYALHAAQPYADITVAGGGLGAASLFADGTPVNATVGASTQVSGGGLGQLSLAGNATVALTGAGELTVTGTGGPDAFKVSVAPAGNTTAVTDGPVFTAVNVGPLHLNGAPGSSANSLALSTVGAAAVNFAPASANSGTVTAAATPISLSNIEGFTYDAQAGNAALTVTGSAAANLFTLTPGATNDAGTVALDASLPVTFQNLGAGGSLNLDGAGGADALVYNGTAANDAFSVNNAGAGGLVNLNARVPVTTSPSIQTLTLNGLVGDDSFTLLPAVSASVFTTLNFNGGASTTAAGNTASLVGTAADDSFTISGQSVGLGGVIVNSSGMTNIALDALGGTNTLTYNGVAGTVENINVIGSSAPAAGKISVPGVSLVTFVNAQQIAVNANPADSDTVTFTGTNGSDVYNINLNAVGTAADPVLKLLTGGGAGLLTLLNYTGVNTLNIAGLDGADKFNVYTGPSVGRSIAITGSIPSGKKKLTDLLTIYYVMPKPKIIASTATQSPAAGLVSLQYSAGVKDLIQYAGVENVVIKKL